MTKSLRDPAILWLLLAFAIGNLADLATTWLFLTQQHGQETIPLYRWLYGAYPFAIGALIKLLASALAALWALLYYRSWRIGGIILLATITLAQLLVVAWNLVWIAQLAR